jgi:eukaryotic-like serine/threonine-protein kinase
MTLEHWLREDRPLAARYRVMESLGDIIQSSHERGRTHGAVKPQNIEITTDLQCELADHSMPHSPMDLPSYRAPELSGGGPATAKSDIFSVGVVMYEILTGSHPFAGDTRAGTEVQPPPLRSVRPDVSKDLADAVTACIERDPEWRPTDLGYVLEVLRRLRGDASPAAKGAVRKAGKPPAAAAKPAKPAASRASDRGGPATPIFTRAAPPERRFPVLPIVIGGGVLLAAGVGLWLRSVFSDPKVSGPTPTTVARAAATPVPAATADPLALPSASAPVTTLRTAVTPPPTPVPTPSAVSETPVPVATPTARAATPAPTPVATPTAVAALATPEPVPTPPQAVETPPPTVGGPAELTAVSPFKVRSTGQALLDVHGRGLRPDHQAVLLKGKAGVAGFVVTRQRYMNPGLVMVFVRMDGVAPGKYTLAMADGSGTLTNQMRVEVTP